MADVKDPKAKALEALELAALKEAIEDKNAGKKLSREQLRLIDRLRAAAPAQKSEPDPNVELLDRPGFNGICLRWVSLAECAKELGVTERWLNNWKRGVKKCTPPIPFKLESRKTKVQPAVVYQHLKTHAAKGSPKMRTPAGYVESNVAEPVDLFAEIDLSGNPHQLIQKILTNKELLQGLSEAKIRAVVAAAAEMGRDKERQSRMDGAIKADKVLAMLRALIFVFVNLIHERATARASALLKFLMSEFAIDIARTNPAAIGLIADFLRVQAQEDITALQEELRQQCEGVRLPELEDDHDD